MIECTECGWVGEEDETLIDDESNDTCPECGNTDLDYIIDPASQ